jgi:glycolate oxidase FAD binding subunit
MTGLPVFQPDTADEVAAFLRERSAADAPVRLRGGGSKAEFGTPAGNETFVDLSKLAGITLYEPGELVLTARAGTPLSEIEAAIAESSQCMAFEPPVFGALFGTGADAAPTLGGTVASGWSGPRRVKAGAVRDHVLGALAVGGEGEVFKSGGRVVKNVTGFDLPKLLTGSHGTLAALTEITIKVLPAPEATRTLAILGLHDEAAILLLSELLGGPYEVSGAAHLPATAAARSAISGLGKSGGSATLVRLEGFGPSVADRFAGLETRCRQHPVLALGPEESAVLWREVRDVARLAAPDGIVWRLTLPPTDAASTVAAMQSAIGAEAFYDWGGGLVWLSLKSGDAHDETVRRLLPAGHAMLMRAPAEIRAVIPVFQPPQPALAALQARVKSAFDPQGILAPGFMGPGHPRTG